MAPIDGVRQLQLQKFSKSLEKIQCHLSIPGDFKKINWENKSFALTSNQFECYPKVTAKQGC